MPLFIDLHMGNFTEEEIRQAHQADLAAQKKYGVRYRQILHNHTQGYIFCIMEGPNKDACVGVHMEAHGNAPCNILEITDVDFQSYLGNRKINEHDITINKDGTIDSGNRYILLIDLIGTHEDYTRASEIISSIVQLFEGRQVESPVNRGLAIFNSGRLALDAALEVHSKFEKNGLLLECRMGIGGGPPVSMEGDFFVSARKTAERMCFISSPNSLILPSWIGEQSLRKRPTASLIKELDIADEKFVARFIDTLEAEWGNNDISIGVMALKIGMSKSQIARKIIAIAGTSPNSFINELRLRKAYRLLEQGDKNISEITLEVGLNNPSYFAKCFRKRFGFAPSDLRSRTFQS